MTRIRALVVAAVVFGGMSAPLMAASYTWDITKTGAQVWNDSNNWGGAAFPNAAGDVADFGVALTANTTSSPPASGVTVGILNVSPTTAFNISIGTNNNGLLTFDNLGAGAQLNFTSGVATQSLRTKVALNDNLTINITNTATRTLRVTNGGISGGAFGLTKTGNGILYLDAGNSYTGLTLISAGKIQLSGGNVNNLINGDLTVNSGASLQNQDFEGISNSALVTMNGSWNMGGNMEIVGLLAGTGSISASVGGSHLGSASASGSATFSGAVTGTGTNVGAGSTNSYTKSGGSVQQFAGAGANEFTGGVLVTGGRLELNKTPGVNAIGSAAVVTTGTVQTGGEVRLLNNDQIADTMNMALSGGTFNANGFSETLGALSLPVASTISTLDLGAGASIVKFADSSAQTWDPTSMLDVLNWSGLATGGGTDQVFSGTSGLGLTGAELADIVFVNPAGFAPGNFGATILSTGEVVPVPEPATGMLLLIGGIGLMLRRKRK